MSFIGKILAQKRAKTTQKEALASAQQLLKDKINVDGKVGAFSSCLLHACGPPSTS